MTDSTGLTAVGIALIALTSAVPAHAQSLESASLGTTGMTLTNPKTIRRPPGRMAVERTRSTYLLTVRVGNAYSNLGPINCGDR